ncbi:type II toxin-antitoxin system death-on-curing family toxin [Candidatus Micrarchaeota archaeon]|nr:type II toxin-antitoxin system death-on-curing family toxin [Candidatus Micrarchaeota archaeon]
MLTKKQIIQEHDKLIELFGGTLGMHYDGKIERTIERYNESKNKKEACIEFYYEIIVGHPFVDGNKRTATHFLEHLLELNGYRLNATNEQIVKMALDIARKNEEMEKKKRTPVSLDYVKDYTAKFII